MNEGKRKALTYQPTKANVKGTHIGTFLYSFA